MRLVDEAGLGADVVREFGDRIVLFVLVADLADLVLEQALERLLPRPGLSVLRQAVARRQDEPVLVVLVLQGAQGGGPAPPRKIP
jgi:hypothetical protein